MKKSLFFFFLFVLSFSRCFSHISQDSIPDDDKLLSKVKSLLPDGWSILIYEKVLVIQKEELAYILYENRINAPVSMESREDINKRILAKGKMIVPKYVFSYSPKLKQVEIETIKNQNDSLLQIINSLPKKYNIECLLDKFASSKGGEHYTGTTDEEKDRIKEFEKEKKSLLENFKEFPDYNTEKYSLYLDIIIGMEDQLHLVC
ncbi:MAG: hypothetical protein WC358_02450, partial [Ignavibacteria bacterium]